MNSDGNKKPKCKVWFCTDDGYSSSGYCPRHQRQLTRSGNPLAGRDAILLNRSYLQLRRVLKGVMDGVIYVDHNDIAHCQVCKAASAPHGKIPHVDGCAVVEAKQLLLAHQTDDKV
jgi:hypothetical protein